ncbi:TNF receptor-associated factor 5 [Geodia barretti]|uniref:TNF receptor-associated factor 5 n=2 Tax=Geodia barretti TaxID=519541 RepID=A0AA35RIC5_GEOBA|nr:TNF receptor-associated factor 5 [Geodia barretti]
MRTHRDNCPLEHLDCPYGSHQPAKKILRKNMKGHKLDCEHRPYRCRYCYMKRGTYKSITGKGESPLQGECHYDVCGQYLLECPNKCGKKSIKRKNIPLHRERCPLEKLNCPFKYAGCSLPVLRKNMDRHCNKGVQNHLLLVAEAHQKLAGKCDELTRKNEELVRKVEELAPNPKRIRLSYDTNTFMF